MVNKVIKILILISGFNIIFCSKDIETQTPQRQQIEHRDQASQTDRHWDIDQALQDENEEVQRTCSEKMRQVISCFLRLLRDFPYEDLD